MTTDTLHIDFFKALADATRLRMLGLLAVRERTVAELAEAVGVRAPTASHHLAQLRALGLVAVRAEGTRRVYRFDDEALQRLAKESLAPSSLQAIGEAVDADAADVKIVRGYLRDGRLTVIPSQRKKRVAVLRALAGRFEGEREYSEAEVNDVIRVWHDDVATLRRELVMGRWLLRDDRCTAYRLNPEAPEGPLPTGRW